MLYLKKMKNKREHSEPPERRKLMLKFVKFPDGWEATNENGSVVYEGLTDEMVKILKERKE